MSEVRRSAGAYAVSRVPELREDGAAQGGRICQLGRRPIRRSGRMKPDRLICGSCGGDVFRLFARDPMTGTEMICECDKCLSTSIVRPATPKLAIIWGENSDGALERVRAKK